MRNRFDEQLALLKKEMIEMGAMCEEAIALTARALTEGNISLAEKVESLSQSIDQMERDIESRCLKLLLQQQPVAKDFREVSCALKMITDIERFGDQASDIGDIVYTFGGAPYIKKLTHITEMGKLAIKMVSESVNSFIRNDEALADEVVALDDTMDDLFLTVKEELISLIRKDGSNGDQAIELMMIAKYLERIGDHAVNVAEWTKYNETGVHTKY